ncbi:hypothetical protein GCM10009841_26490 [Microlunatus panaciterrae]|uniref:Diguanylate cyclase (GGDEF)-like protein n=1 Tax=Microlunatus panaciterrae TaxID=400768 RepID=A0ABS2RIF6_9ACTN|nr:response regulator [Microlunatus panaciterrae]MBM7798468.1 diguanylate cyclase (GGDEF)-like protein [Microlunatus panaciterrae]
MTQEAADRAQNALEAIAERALQTNLARVTELEDAVMATLEGRLDAEQRQSAKRAAHQLAGSAGTFGYPRSSELSERLERFFERGALVDPAELLAATSWLEALQVDLSRPLASREASDDPTGRSANDSTAENQQVAGHLLLAHPDRQLAPKLIHAARARGLVGHWAPDLERAITLQQRHRPNIVLLDPELPPGEGLELLTGLTGEGERPDTFILTTDEDVDRVAAIRAGVTGFLSATLPPDRLLTAALDTVARRQPQPARVLAVDDDPLLLEAIQELFAGTLTEITAVTDPLQVWEALRQTDPDLLLLDVDMPGATGLELCRMVRADPTWAALPVLILTGSIGPTQVRSVFEAGADDYVAKPFVGPELVSRVNNRLERVRLLRGLAENDQLTGLVNRHRLEVQFARLQALAAGEQQPLSIGLLDVDGLKRLNREHGHTFGDSVLQSLSDVLANAFSGDDVVGRWAGQELVVAMYGMHRDDGVARVAALRNEFQRRRFELNGQQVSVTFSAAVAELGPDGKDLHQLFRAATGTVAVAKRAGGDRVVATGWRPSGDETVTDVLVIEDDDALAGLLQHALESRGLSSRQLRDGAEALRRLTGPDRLSARVIVLDVDLPGINGLDLLSLLSQKAVLAHTRVIMLTARAGEAEVLSALQSGAFDHVAKPFSVPVLMQRIRRALDG